MPISRGSEQQPLGSILMAPLTASEPSQACDCPRVPEVRPLIVTDPDCSQEACFGCGRVPDCGAFECLPFQAMQFRLKPALPRVAHSGQRFIQQVDGFVGATGCAAQPSHHTTIVWHLELRSDVPLRL